MTNFMQVLVAAFIFFGLATGAKAGSGPSSETAFNVEAAQDFQIPFLSYKQLIALSPDQQELYLQGLRQMLEETLREQKKYPYLDPLFAEQSIGTSDRAVAYLDWLFPHALAEPTAAEQAMINKVQMCTTVDGRVNKDCLDAEMADSSYDTKKAYELCLGSGAKDCSALKVESAGDAAVAEVVEKDPSSQPKAADVNVEAAQAMRDAALKAQRDAILKKAQAGCTDEKGQSENCTGLKKNIEVTGKSVDDAQKMLDMSIEARKKGVNFSAVDAAKDAEVKKAEGGNCGSIALSCPNPPSKEQLERMVAYSSVYKNGKSTNLCVSGFLPTPKQNEGCLKRRVEDVGTLKLKCGNSGTICSAWVYGVEQDGESAQPAGICADSYKSGTFADEFKAAKNNTDRAAAVAKECGAQSDAFKKAGKLSYSFVREAKNQGEDYDQMVRSFNHMCSSTNAVAAHCQMCAKMKEGAIRASAMAKVKINCERDPSVPEADGPRDSGGKATTH